MAKRTVERQLDIRGILAPERVFELHSRTKDSVINELCTVTSRHEAVTDPDRFLRAIHDREKLMSTGIGSGIAVPHAKIRSVNDFIMSIGRAKDGVDFEALDGKPVYIVILIGAPNRERQRFLSLMAKIGEVFDHPGFRTKFLDAENPDEMYRLLIDEFDSV